eukprot:TRINITY_DN400_c0_g1_i1.p1 TRINITY_DN400_c0_g1~~TRINITY_DN400_c0_g1_i1.p1  ORF type:complete len:400 (+),score=69.65 TRINITY_DN400_c0_g1_i1:51-1202(+)
MGSGASAQKKLVPPQINELPKKPNINLPLWNEHCKGMFRAEFQGDGEKKWRERYHLQQTKLFIPGADFTDRTVMDNLRREYAATVSKTAGMMRRMASAQVVKTEVVDANKYIGDRECKLRPGYMYNNSALKLLVITPKKKLAGPLPAIVLAAPISLDNSDVSLYDWMGNKWAATLGAVVVLVGFRTFPQAEHPAGVMDLVAAVKWTHAKATALGVDTSRISLAAQSAGGFVACPAPFELVMRGEAELLKSVILESPAMFPDGMFGNCNGMSEFQRYIWTHPYKAMYIGTAGDNWKELEEKKDPSLFVLHIPKETLQKAPKHVIACAEFDDLAWVYCDYAHRLNCCGVLQDFLMVPGLAHINICAAIWMDKPKYYVDGFLKGAI